MTKCIFPGCNNEAEQGIVPMCRKCGAERTKSNDVLVQKKKVKKEKISSAKKWRIWGRDNFTCQQCGSRKNLSVDHIKPESKGGSGKDDNLQTLCKSCNSKKGNR